MNRQQRRRQTREQARALRRAADPVSPDPDAALSLAIRHHQAGRLQEAERLYRRILRGRPDHADALHLLGVTAHQAGDSAVAVELIGRAIAINARVAEYHNNIGEAYSALGRPDTAVACYNKALAINPDFVEAHDNLGKVLKREGRMEEALASYQRAIEIAPDRAEAHNNLGNVLKILGRRDQALVSYQRALRLDPDHAQAHNNLGAALQDMGRLEDAIQWYRRAIQLVPHFAEAHINLGAALKDQGKQDEAIACYQRAVESGRNSAKHVLAALRGETTETAPRDYVTEYFDNFAPRFENDLVGGLGYTVPRSLKNALDKFATRDRRFRNVIDLGCGTGLAGAEFRAVSSRLIGVDVSTKMIAQAKKKKVYDSLEEEDIAEFLNKTDETYDLYVAADVFVYVGNLAPIFSAVRKRAREKALFTFSTEICEGGDYSLNKTARYSHSRGYIEALAQDQNFSVELCDTSIIRKENGENVPGYLFILEYNNC